MVKIDKAVLQTQPLSVYNLYDDYGAMLLGYIFEVVKDKKVAEDYLVQTFSSVALKFNEINWSESNKWGLLQRIAKNELAKYNEAAADCDAHTTAKNATPNKYLDKMTDEQKLVFCNVYYSKRTTAQLAAEINKPEELVKKLLKEAFAIIRKSNEN